MSSTFTVDPASLRSAAAALTSEDLSRVSPGWTGPVVAGPATAAAMAQVMDLMSAYLEETGTRLRHLAGGLREAADRYGQVDERARGRLTAVRDTPVPR